MGSFSCGRLNAGAGLLIRRRGKFVRIAAQPDRQENDEKEKESKWDQITQAYFNHRLHR